MIGKMRLIDANALVTQIDLQRKASKASYPKQSFCVGDVINCIRNAPAVGAVETQWIPVSTPPSKGGEYLCRCIVKDYNDLPFYMVLSYYSVDKNPHFQHEEPCGMNVTHWKPFDKME